MHCWELRDKRNESIRILPRRSTDSSLERQVKQKHAPRTLLTGATRLAWEAFEVTEVGSDVLEHWWDLEHVRGMVPWLGTCVKDGKFSVIHQNILKDIGKPWMKQENE